MASDLQYVGLDMQPSRNLPLLKYQIDNYDEREWRQVPESWFTPDLSRYKYPSEDYKSSGVLIKKWTESIFDRNYYPRSEWPEHKTGTLEMKAFRKYIFNYTTT